MSDVKSNGYITCQDVYTVCTYIKMFLTLNLNASAHSFLHIYRSLYIYAGNCVQMHLNLVSETFLYMYRLYIHPDM